MSDSEPGIVALAYIDKALRKAVVEDPRLAGMVARNARTPDELPTFTHSSGAARSHTTPGERLLKKVRIEERELLCELSQDERIQRGTQLGSVVQEIASLEAQKKAATESYGAQIKLAKSRRDKLAEAAKTGRELQAVSCNVLADIARGCYVTVRTDTGEEVDSRAMSSSELDHERQTDLDLGEKKKGDTEGRSNLADESKPKDNPVDEEKSEEADPNLVDAVDGWSRGECNDWLRSKERPVPTGRGAHGRAKSMIKAVMRDDYDEPAAESAFGPLKWQGGNQSEGSTRLRQNGAQNAPEDDAGADTPETAQEPSGDDADPTAEDLGLTPPIACSGCGKPAEECDGGADCVGF
jgi:hypothetical protein